MKRIRLQLITITNRTIVRNASSNVESGLGQDSEIKSWKEIPGPPSLPIIGQIHSFLPGGDFYNLGAVDLINKLVKKYGPIVKMDAIFGRPPIIFVADPEASAQVLRGENWMPYRPGFFSLEYYRKEYKKTKDPKRITGLITDQGEPWKEVRSKVNHVMLQPKTIKLYSSTLDEVARDMIKRMKSRRDEKYTIKGPFDMEMNLWALESIAVVALGRRLNCLDPNLPKDSPARKLIHCVHNMFVIANNLDYKLDLWRYYPTKAFKEGMKLYGELESLTKYFIDMAIQELKTKGSKPENEKGVLEKLLEIDEKIAVLMASDMLFAGVDTTANVITGALYQLAKNPEKQEKLREAIMSEEKTNRYAKACIKETNRLLPVVAGNLRMTTKEYNILGYKIPKEMLVTFSHQYMSLLEEQYPKPHEFIPERWLTDKEDCMYHGNAHPFAYSPFGFGVRSCIGRRIAELEAETFLSRLVESFRIEWTGPPPQIKSASLNYFTGPFNFIFKDV